MLSHNEYACNTLAAFEELTVLHARSLELDKWKVKGEANRARTATIERKAGNAHAAESAFRSCVQKLIPELLNEWENQSKQGKLKYYHTKHKMENGFDLDVLKKTAIEVEKSG